MLKVDKQTYSADLEQHGGEALPSAESSEKSPEKEHTMKMTTTPLHNKIRNAEIHSLLIRHDLQFYPLFLYFVKVERDGKQQHKQAVNDGKIDRGYI